jgi:hypothetical protein
LWPAIGLREFSSAGRVAQHATNACVELLAFVEDHLQHVQHDAVVLLAQPRHGEIFLVEALVAFVPRLVVHEPGYVGQHLQLRLHQVRDRPQFSDVHALVARQLLAGAPFVRVQQLALVLVQG